MHSKLITVTTVISLIGTNGLAALWPANVNAQAKPHPGTVHPVLDPYQHRERFIGSWLMSRRTPDGGEASWLIKRSPGGTYRRITRIIQPDGNQALFEDVGRWGIVNKSLFTMMRGRTRPGQDALNRADPADPYSYDAYWVDRISDSKVELKSMHSGQLLTERKVADSFSFGSKTKP